MKIDLEKDSLANLLFDGVKPITIYKLIDKETPLKREKILKKFNNELIQALSVQLDRNYHHMCLLAKYLNK